METATPVRNAATNSERSTLPKNGFERVDTTHSEVSGVQLGMQQILHHLREGRNLGPLMVLLAVLIYSLLSPYLPAPIHDYIYHIAH
jgi:hypothetical protein